MRRAALALVAFALLLAAGGPGRGQQKEAAREAELEAIRGEIAELQAKLGELQNRTSGIEGELERVQVELALQEKRVAEAAAARDIAADRVAASEAEIARLEQELAAMRVELGRRVTTLYRLGRHGTVRLALSLRPGSDLLQSIRLLRFLARRDATLIERHVDAEARLATERDGLAAERAAAEAWFTRERERRDGLARLETRQAQLLAGSRAESAELAHRALALADRERKLSNFLDFLYGRNSDALAGRPMPEFRGVLDWPAEGRVTAEFGPRLDPRYRTRVPHNGVDLAVAPETPVRAVYPGKVVFAAPFEGYGPTVVVAHAGRVFTLYAGLTAIETARDDMVSLRAVLGRASGSVYFEIRVENRPENPRDWLRTP